MVVRSLVDRIGAPLDRVMRTLLGRARLSRAPRVPRLVNWDLTYACPLRCTHCYSESGRRASRQLPLRELLSIADVFLALRPIPEIVFTGGEPLVVKGFLDVAEHLASRGAKLALYTSGWKLDRDTARSISRMFSRVAVSIDGGDRAVNDRIRGRPFAFDAALDALALLDALESTTMRFGVECTVVKSNLTHLESLCRSIAPRFPRLSFLHFGAAIPTGLASEASFAQQELLSNQELSTYRASASRLSALAPPTVRVRVVDNVAFQMHRDQIARGLATDHLVKIEADGRMRAMDIYEGTVGDVRQEPFDVLWRRACARHRDPFVIEALAKVGSMVEWAAATRAIDRHFAAPDDLLRIDKRAGNHASSARS